MILKKLKLKNFKKFNDHLFEFNDDINIIVGDNESGKSTLLEAIELCLNLTYRGKPLSQELSTDLFSADCIKQYLAGNKAQDSLPEILIECYLDGNPDTKGNNNTLAEDTEGLFIRVYFDTDMAGRYVDFINDPAQVTTLPVEFYKYEWYSFAWKPLTVNGKKVSCLTVDATRLHPTYGRTKYINSILNSTLGRSSRSTLNLNYRQLRATFETRPDVKEINDNLDTDNAITEKSLKITADVASAPSWESGLQLAVNDVAFDQIGKGEQSQIQIKLALRNKGNEVDIVLIEEPENHLSHMNLVRLLNYIESKNHASQIFLTTHSSYVLNKLSINKLCLLSDGYVRLKDLDTKTVKTVKRLPGYDTLRAVLARRVILVEGPSDELLVKKLFILNNGCLPEERGIDVIVVRGIGFRSYLNIVKYLGHRVHVIKDNDGDYSTNIAQWETDFKACDFINVYSPTSNDESSLEPALIEANSENELDLDKLARLMFSVQTYTEYGKCSTISDKKSYMREWYAGNGAGSKKVDSAIRLFDSSETINYPAYLKEAITF